MCDVTDTVQSLRQTFFAHRNGIVADVLRHGGAPQPYIMGCQLADIKQIVSHYTPDANLARALWADRSHRECRLAAILLYPASAMSRDEALAWAHDVQCFEEADVLCHGLLRHIDKSIEVAEELAFNGQDLERYCGLRLLLNLDCNGRLNHDQLLRKRLAHLRDNDPTLDASQLNLLTRLLDD